eukprot:gene22083-26608_t
MVSFESCDPVVSTTKEPVGEYDSQNTSSQLSLAPATPKSALVTDSEAPGHSLTVECGALVGSLDLNSLKVSQSDKSKKRKLERIVYDGVEYSGGQFEQLAGKGSRRDWKKSCRVVQPGATREEWISVRQWLAENIAVQRHPENKLDPVAAIADPAAAPSTGDDRGNTATVVQVENERLQDVEQVSNKSPVPSIFQAHSNRQGLSSQYRGVSWCKGLQKWRAQLPYAAAKHKQRHLGYFREEQFQEALVLSESVAQVAEQLEWLEAEILITSAEWQGHSREQWASTVAQLQEHGAEHGEAGEEASAEQLRRLVTELKNGVAQEMVEKLWDLWDTRGQDACHAAVKRFLKHGHVAEARPPLEPKQAFDNLPSGTHHGDNKDEHSGLLTVECGELEGVLDLDTLKITYDGLELAGGQFERMAGKGSRKVWKKSCRVVEPNVPREEWISVWQWLEENLRQNQQHEQGAEATTATAEAPCYNDDEDDADDYQAAKRQRVAPVRYRAGSGGTQGRGRRPMLPPGGLTDDSDMSAQDVGVATLAALGLAQNAELSPDGRDGTTDTLEMAMAMAMAQASQSADQSPGKRILVECGSLIGKLDVATLKIMYDGREVSGGQFERLAGKGSRKVWKKSCRVVEPNVPREEWITVRQWLADNGFAQADAPASGAVGDAVVVANLTNPTAFRKPKSRKPTEGVQVSKLQSADARPKATLSRDSALHGTRDDEGNGQLVVECGELEGVLDLDTLKITYDGLELAGGQFERLAGKGSRKVWKKSCRVVQQQVPREEWISVWQWLEENQRRNAPEPRAEAATEPQWSIDKEAQEQANAQARRSRLASRNRDGLGAEESWGCGGAEDDTMQQVMEMAEVMGSWRSVGPSSDRPPKLEPEPEGTVAQRLETASLPPGLKFEKNHAKPTKYLLGRFQTEMQQAQANDEAAKAQSNSTAEVKPLELRPTERSEGTTTCEREGKDGSEASRTAGLLQAAPMQTERSAASEQSAPAVLSSRKGLSSQYLGVSWCEELQKWRAQLPYAAAKHKQRHLGYFREEVAEQLEWLEAEILITSAEWQGHSRERWVSTVVQLQEQDVEQGVSEEASAEQLRRLVTELKVGLAEEMVEKLWELWDTRGLDACHAAVKRFLKHGHVAEARPLPEPKPGANRVHGAANVDVDGSVLTVECGELQGVLDVSSLRITYDGMEVGGGQFERLAGRGSRRDWKKSCRVVQPDEPREAWVSVRQWLAESTTPSGQAERRPTSGPSKDPAGKARSFQASPPIEQTDMLKHVLEMAEVMGSWRAAGPHPEVKQDSQMEQQANVDQDSEMEQQNDVDQDSEMEQQAFTDQDSEMEQRGTAYEEPKPDEVKALKAEAEKCSLIATQSKPDTKQESKVSREGQQLPEVERTCPKMTTAAPGLKFEKNHAKPTKYLLGRFQTEMQQAQVAEQLEWLEAEILITSAEWQGHSRERWVSTVVQLQEQDVEQGVSEEASAEQLRRLVTELKAGLAEEMVEKLWELWDTNGLEACQASVMRFVNAGNHCSSPLGTQRPLEVDTTNSSTGSLITVECGGLTGVLNTNCMRITYDGKNVTGSHFERLAGRGSRRDWKKSCRVVQSGDPREAWISVRQWLVENNITDMSPEQSAASVLSAIMGQPIVGA